MSLLKIDNLHTYYGHVYALKGISLEVKEGEIITLLGANGAGKSTTLRAISGLVPIQKGTVAFNGNKISGVPAHEIVNRGISHVPEGRKVFATLTVDENLNLGAYTRQRDKEGVEQSREQVFQLFPRLEERRSQLAGTLSGGEQQMLAMGRALMGRPKLLMLDEPSLGLAPILVQAIFRTIREINERGVTVLLVEQNARAALRLASRAYVLEVGSVTLQGKTSDLIKDARVRKAYLGEK